jgi:hypothetical protein
MIQFSYLRNSLNYFLTNYNSYYNYKINCYYLSKYNKNRELLLKEIINKCGCFSTLYDNLDTNSRPCLNITDVDCFETYYYKFEQIK